MQTALKLTTTILPGQRIELSSPELPEGTAVEVIVLIPEPAAPARRTVLDFLDSQPVGPRTAATWDEIESRFRQERDGWS